MLLNIQIIIILVILKGFAGLFDCNMKKKMIALVFNANLIMDILL